MMDTQSISIVIPLYNKSLHIARALNSVLVQTLQDFEIIVVNDGSTDDGAEIVRGFHDPRIRLIEQENQGVSAARNRGIRAARAELVAFLDADDEWLPNHLEVINRLRTNHPEAGAFGTAYLKKSGDMVHPVVFPHMGVPKKPWEGLIPSYFRAAARGMIISSSTVAVPKAVLAKVGGFTTNAWWGEDGDLWGRIALNYPIAFSWDGMGIYHTDAMNMASKRIEPVIESPFIHSARNALLAGDVLPELRDDLREYLAVIQLCTAYRNLAARRPDLARKNLKECRTQRRLISKYWTLFWTYIPSDIYIKLKQYKHGPKRSMSHPQSSQINNLD